MSLDWNTKECPGNGVTAGWIKTEEGQVGFQERESYLHPDTNSLVWGAMCGYFIGEITPKNIDEVVWRVEFLKHINRPWMSDGSFPTPEAIDQHLGLVTNCDGKTRKQWLAFMTKSLSDSVDRDVARLYKETG